MRALLTVAFLLTSVVSQAQDDLTQLRTDCIAGMKRAAEYYRTKVAVRGGYVYYYSLDLQTRWGEGRATADQIWVQPRELPRSGWHTSARSRPRAISSISTQRQLRPRHCSTVRWSPVAGSTTSTSIRTASGLASTATAGEGKAAFDPG